MTDIVERLNDSLSAGYSELRKEAVLEIECLRAKVEATEEDRSRFLVEMGRLCAQCDALRAEIEELHVLIAAVKKQAGAEFCLRVKKEEEYTRLRAKIEQMEQQAPARLVTPTAYRWRYRGAIKWQYGELTEETVQVAKEHNHEVQSLYALPSAQQCKNCNGMGDRFDPSGEKIPCDLCESHLEEMRSLVAEAAHDIISGSDFWLSISLAAKKIYALPGAKGEEK